MTRKISLFDATELTRTEIKDVKRKLPNLIRQVVAAGGKMNATNTILEEAEKALEDFTDRDEEALTAARQECQEWHTMLRTTNKESEEYDDVHTEWTAAKAKLAAATAQNAEARTELLSNLQAAQNAYDDCKKQLDAQNAAKQRVENRLIELNEELAKLLAKYEEVKNRMAQAAKAPKPQRPAPAPKRYKSAFRKDPGVEADPNRVSPAVIALPDGTRIQRDQPQEEPVNDQVVTNDMIAKARRKVRHITNIVRGCERKFADDPSEQNERQVKAQRAALTRAETALEQLLNAEESVTAPAPEPTAPVKKLELLPDPEPVQELDDKLQQTLSHVWDLTNGLLNRLEDEEVLDIVAQTMLDAIHSTLKKNQDLEAIQKCNELLLAVKKDLGNNASVPVSTLVEAMRRKLQSAKDMLTKHEQDNVSAK